MTEDILNETVSDVVNNFNEPETPQKTEKEINDEVVNALVEIHPRIEEVTDLSVSENGSINIEIKDFTKFSIPISLYNGNIYGETEYLDRKTRLISDIYTKVAIMCNESGKYEIFSDGYLYKVIKTSEREDYEMDMMTEEEKESYIEKKAQEAINNKRAERDSILTSVVDPVVTNPLRWSELSEKEQEDYKRYRLYLLNIPQQENFPNIEILSFEDFKNGLDNLDNSDI